MILLIIAAIIGLKEMTRSLFRTPDRPNNGILATEKTNQLQKDSLRKQIISFNRIQVVDSINQLVLIPVTQANLAAAEKNQTPKNTKSIGRYNSGYKQFHGNIYNNLVLHDETSNKSEILFDTRVSINDFLVHENEDKKYIVIPACNIDSNKDGYLNEKDLQELFIYDLQKRSLHKIAAQENYTTLRVYQPHQSTDLVAHFGIDRNQNGKFSASDEPMIFYRVNLTNMSIEEYLNQDQIDKLQGLLEGK